MLDHESVAKIRELLDILPPSLKPSPKSTKSVNFLAKNNVLQGRVMFDLWELVIAAPKEFQPLLWEYLLEHLPTYHIILPYATYYYDSMNATRYLQFAVRCQSTFRWRRRSTGRYHRGWLHMYNGKIYASGYGRKEDEEIDPSDLYSISPYTADHPGGWSIDSNTASHLWSGGDGPSMKVNRRTLSRKIKGGSYNTYMPRQWRVQGYDNFRPV